MPACDRGGRREEGGVEVVVGKARRGKEEADGFQAVYMFFERL
jgi:hypothetical protein